VQKWLKIQGFANRDGEWLTARHRFLRQRLYLWLWLLFVCLLTFTLRNIYNFYFPLKEQIFRTQELAVNSAMMLSLLICVIIHHTRFGHRYPGLLFLVSSWSVSLTSPSFAVTKGFALPNTLAWSLLFLSQATFIPTRLTLHLLSQLGVLVYYFGINRAGGLKTDLILDLFWACIISDVSVYLYDRLQRSEFYARKKLEVAETKYRTIFENALEGIFQANPDGRYITANSALARIYGYKTPQEVIAHLTDYVDPQRWVDFVDLIEKYGGVSEFESQIYRQDGSIVWISQKAYAVRDEQGKLLYYEGLIEDITQRKGAEVALQEQLDFLQVLIDTIPAPVYYKNTHGLYLGCNQACEASLGLSKEQILGKSVYDLAPKDLADQYYHADTILFEQQQVQSYEGSLEYADGTQHDVIFYKAAFAKADGTPGGLVGVILDISDRKRTETAMRVFLHAVSHDLRNPVLGTLMVLRNLLSSPGEKIVTSRSILERMAQSSDRQLNLINSLMEAHISEVQGFVLQLQPIQLHPVVAAAISDLEPMLVENQVILINLVSADLPTVNGDFTQLWRVFSNLIVNAIKHNLPGLRLTINAEYNQEKIYCTVSDNGVGINTEQSRRLFDLYYQGSNIRSSVSLGLGLYLCQQIIHAHGGEIGVQTAPQAGATFWFTLPVRSADGDL